MDVPDEFTRGLVVEAPLEWAWRAITDPEELVRGFPDKVAEVDLRPSYLEAA